MADEKREIKFICDPVERRDECWMFLYKLIQKENWVGINEAYVESLKNFEWSHILLAIDTKSNGKH